MGKKLVNPWTNLFNNDGIIADCDKTFFDKQKVTPHQYANSINIKNKDVDLTFDSLPDPYNGNPKSKVYCLCKNPGKPDKCFDGDNNFEKATINNLLLKSQSCFWAETIRNKCGKLHDGVEWLAKRTKRLKEILEGHPDIFFIEYFPYHSSKGFDFPKHLPSYDFSDALIKQAMQKGKLIIIMREKKGWFDRIDGLKNYHNLCFLKCAQGGYLTPDNIVREGTKNPLTIAEIKEYFKL